jgi:hypothetical protein
VFDRSQLELINQTFPVQIARHVRDIRKIHVKNTEKKNKKNEGCSHNWNVEFKATTSV